MRCSAVAGLQLFDRVGRSGCCCSGSNALASSSVTMLGGGENVKNITSKKFYKQIS